MEKIEKKVLRFIRSQGCISGPEIHLALKIDTVTLDGLLRSLENEGLISIDLLGNCRALRDYCKQKPEQTEVSANNNPHEVGFMSLTRAKGKESKEKERRDNYKLSLAAGASAVKLSGENHRENTPDKQGGKSHRTERIIVVEFTNLAGEKRYHYFTSIAAIFEMFTPEEIGCAAANLWNRKLPWTSRDKRVTITREPLIRKHRGEESPE